MLTYAASCSLSHAHTPREGLINISQREEAQTWNLDTLFGHDGRREGPEPTRRGKTHVPSYKRGIPRTINNR